MGGSVKTYLGLSGIITAQQFFDTFGVLSSSMQGTVTSLMEIGAFFGAVMAMFVGQRYGRRWMSFFGSIVMVLGAVLQASSYGIPQLIVGRIVTGWGLGVLTATCPVWLAESSSPENRGRDVSFMLTMLIVGINVAYWLDYGFAYINSSISWRVPLALQIIFCLVITALSLLLPDSPRWLFSQGRIEDGTDALCSLRGLDPNDSKLQEEKEEIMLAIALEEQGDHGWSGLLKDGGVRGNKRVILACSVLFFQQLTGTNCLTYYSTVIYEDSVGLSRSLSLLMGGFLQVWFFVASFATWFMIDRVGRRGLLMLGYCGMGACFLVLWIMLGYPNSKACGIVAIVATFLFQGFFTWGTMATVWAYPSEVLPLALRTRGGALAAATSWIWGFVIVEVTPPGIASLGRNFYWIFIGFNIVMTALTWYYYPETGGLSLEAADALFADVGDEKYEGWRHAVKKSLVLQKERKKNKPKHFFSDSFKRTDVHVEEAEKQA
ncbi:putative hexose carrier protein [Pseudohyphozyma bogoriensis]|nr:putative hexose carrier protein [Pseudohyphozyma bogoriensis]